MPKVQSDLLLDSEEEIESGEWTVVSSNSQFGNRVIRVGEFTVMEWISVFNIKKDTVVKSVKRLLKYLLCTGEIGSLNSRNEFNSKQDAIGRALRMNRDNEKWRMTKTAEKHEQILQQMGDKEALKRKEAKLKANRILIKKPSGVSPTEFTAGYTSGVRQYIILANSNDSNLATDLSND